MITVVRAKGNNLEEIMLIDSDVIGNNSRRSYIEKSISEENCIIAKNGDSIVGFLTYDTNFFDCCFISLVIVKPVERRKGVATALLKHIIKTAPTMKIFSSTNQSNLKMQSVFKVNGFNQSGYIDNLDEGDPEIIYFRTRLIGN